MIIPTLLPLNWNSLFRDPNRSQDSRPLICFPGLAMTTQWACGLWDLHSHY